MCLSLERQWISSFQPRFRYLVRISSSMSCRFYVCVLSKILTLFNRITRITLTVSGISNAQAVLRQIQERSPTVYCLKTVSQSFTLLLEVAGGSFVLVCGVAWLLEIIPPLLTFTSISCICRLQNEVWFKSVLWHANQTYRCIWTLPQFGNELNWFSNSFVNEFPDRGGIK